MRFVDAVVKFIGFFATLPGALLLWLALSLPLEYGLFGQITVGRVFVNLLVWATLWILFNGFHLRPKHQRLKR